MQNTQKALTTIQRFLYTHLIYQKIKYPEKHCFVPVNPFSRNHTDSYLRQLKNLEERNLVVVDRSSDKYSEWIIHLGKDRSLITDQHRKQFSKT